MIDKDTIDEIFNTARIEEVINEFVSLKKSGSNYKGLSPFSNERTPSFMVSPAKGIWKDFSTGKGGNVVGFLMESEQFSYPEALKYLAKKYNIEIQEEEKTPEQMEAENERESLYLVTGYAEKFFSEKLHESDEGKAIGLSYFHERGFRDDTIEKFKLGYSPDQWGAFTDTALEKGYQLKYLEKAGLTKVRDAKKFDFFKGRIIFPIHNLTGRAIGFGARTLKKDKKSPKYLNSPETEIYNKSRVLYGMYQAKKSVVNKDNCYLVEGYTDVVSLHQSGIENVVASSGTALTSEQIRLIHRYTKNVTILYDGDAAGIRASFRGIDLILQEGMNVKVVLFPDGEDPDSYSRSVSSTEFQTYIEENAKDFIVFKTDQLLADAENDPVKKSALVHEIVDSIALIPDMITRSVYIQECSGLLGIPEQTLINEMNKVRRKAENKKSGPRASRSNRPETPPPPSGYQGPPPSMEGPPPEMDGPPPSDMDFGSMGMDPGFAPPPAAPSKFDSAPVSQKPLATPKLEYQERDVIRILLTYGKEAIEIEVDNEEDDSKTEIVQIPIAHYILLELAQDSITFNNPDYQSILEIFDAEMQRDESAIPGLQFFVQHQNQKVCTTAVDIGTSPYSLSDQWQKAHSIYVTTEDMKLKEATVNAVFSLKLTRVELMIKELQDQLKNPPSNDEVMEILKRQTLLMQAKKGISEKLGRVVIK